MTISNTQSPTDPQTEKIIESLKNEIASLKFHLRKKDEKIASLEVILNGVMETHDARKRDYEDAKGDLGDVIDMLRKRIPHADILAYLKAEDSNEFQFRKLW